MPAGPGASAHFGYSTAGSDTILAMGMLGVTFLSTNADLGSHFYLSRFFVLGDATASSDDTFLSGGEAGHLYTAVSSAELACMIPRNITYPLVDCLMPDPNAGPVGPAWALAGRLPIPANSACDAAARPGPDRAIDIDPGDMCFGIAAAAWRRAVAVTGKTAGGARYFSTHYAAPAASNGTDAEAGAAPAPAYALACSFGCAAGDEAVAASAEPTFGDAVALWGGVLAVGAPGAAGGRGAVLLFRAAGDPAGDAGGYGAHSAWRSAGRLAPAEEDAAGRYGAALSLGPSLLVVAAPGAGAGTRGAVTAYALARDGAEGNASARALCAVSRPGYALGGGEFGAALAQSPAGPGWTVVAVGAPDESRVYMLWVGDDGACEVRRGLYGVSSERVRGIADWPSESLIAITDRASTDRVITDRVILIGPSLIGPSLMGLSQSQASMPDGLADDSVLCASPQTSVPTEGSSLDALEAPSNQSSLHS